MFDTLVFQGLLSTDASINTIQVTEVMCKKRLGILVVQYGSEVQHGFSTAHIHSISRRLPYLRLHASDSHLHPSSSPAGIPPLQSSSAHKTHSKTRTDTFFSSSTACSTTYVQPYQLRGVIQYNPQSLAKSCRSSHRKGVATSNGIHGNSF